MIAATKTDGMLIWQTPQTDLVAEAAILITPYGDTFVMNQEGDEIIYNYESIPDVIKTLKELHKQYLAGHFA